MTAKPTSIPPSRPFSEIASDGPRASKNPGSTSSSGTRRHALPQSMSSIEVFDKVEDEVMAKVGARAFANTVMAVCLLCLLSAGTTGAAPRGLYVQKGVLMKDNLPYRGIGANCFNLFARSLQDPADTSSLS